MTIIKGLGLSVILLTLAACSGGGGGGTTTTPPVVNPGSATEIVIDPVKLEQPDFGRVTSTAVINSFLNIRNMGSGIITPVNVSLTGLDGSFFSLSNPGCPNLQPDGGNVCTVQVQFNPAGKLNRIYFAQLDVNGVKFPLSVELAIQSSGVSDYQIYQNSEYVANTIDLGKTDSTILQQTVLLKHLLRSAVGNLPIIMTDSNFQLSRTSCPAVEINKAGCPITITFNPTDKATRVYSAPIKIGTGNPIPISLNLKAEKQSGQAMPDFHFYVNNQMISEYSFGTVTVPEKKKVTITVKNEGLGSGVPNINIMPNQIYMIGSNTCVEPLMPNGTCSVDIYATSLNRLANYYTSKLFVANNSMTLTSFVYKTNQCQPGMHLDPDSLLCLPDKQTEIVANGTRSRTWMPAPLPGNWDPWVYTCLEPKFELNESADACIPKRRTLTLETEGTGTISGAVAGIYDFDTVVTLRANPGPFYVFKEWLGGTCFGSTNTCTVTMNQSHTVRAVFFVPPIQVNPNPIQVLVGSGISLSTTGGVPPYYYELVQDVQGTINPLTGIYSGFATPTQGGVLVKDSENRSLVVSLKVARPLAAPTGIYNVTTNSASILGMTDGFPPYTFTKNSGVGTPGEGVYYTGNTPGTAFVTVTDGLGHQKNVNINVVEPLTVTPGTIASEVGKNIPLSIGAGITPYTIQLLGVDGHEPVGNMLGQTYRTGDTPGQAVIKVTDGMNSVVNVPVVVVPTFMLTEPTHHMVINSSWTIGTSGGLGPYTYEQVSGPGVTSAVGVFTAFEVNGTSVVNVTDSLGTTFAQTIKTYQALDIGFTNLKMLVGQQKIISPTGGVGPFSITLKSGAGQITGGNTYSSSVATTAVIKVTDGVGLQSIERTIEVLPEFKLPVNTINLIAGNTYQIIPSGGAAPYTYTLQAGGKGAVNAAGLYATPLESSQDIVKVTDTLGNEINLTINVVLPLQLSTTTPNVYVNQTAQFTATNGLPPFTYRISNGSGGVNNSGLFTAPGVATVASVEVTDSMGTKATANISVYGEFAVTPMTKNLVTGATQQISVSGGKSPYTYEVLSGPGAVTNGGLFVAAGIDGDVVVEVKDSLSGVKTLNYKVVLPLNLAPASLVILTNNTQQFNIAGGLAPFSYSLTQGVGSITQGGLFTAAAQPGSAQIQVLDAMGTTKRVNIEVISPLTVLNENIITTTGKSLALNPSGGLAPYAFTRISGAGEVSQSGIYTAPAVPGNDVIRITDNSGIGQEKLVYIEVKEGLSIIAPNQYITTNQSHTYTASGGLPPYTYFLLSGRGSINQSTGLFNAGALSGDGVVQVSDALGNTDETIIQVLNPLDLLVQGGGMVVNQSKNISGSGGLGPYTYAIISGGGTLVGSNYTAPATEGSVTIRVTDALSQQVDKTFGVYSVLTRVSVNNFERGVNQTYQAEVSGGLAPYEYYVISGNGTINPATGLYSSTTATSVVLKVLDSIGQEVVINGTIYSPLTISPANSTIVFGDTQIFSGSGGKSPYTYQLVSGVGVLTNNEYFADEVGSATIKVTDSLGQTVQTGITVNSNLVLNAGSCSYDIPETVSCSVGSSGGIGTRTYSVNIGTINPTTGEFKGQCVNNLGQSTVMVTDSQGSFKTITLNYPCADTSCSAVIANGHGTVSGNYWIDPDGLNSGTLTPTQLYCEFDSNGAWTLNTRLNTNDGTARYYTDTTFWEGSGVGTLSGSNDFMAPYFANNAGFREIRLKYTSSYGTVESVYRNASNTNSLKQNFLLAVSNSNPTWSRVFTGSGESGNFFGGSLIFKTRGNGPPVQAESYADLSRIWYNHQSVGECNQGGSIGHNGDYQATNWKWEVARGWSGGGTCQANTYRLALGTNYENLLGGTLIAPTDLYNNGIMYIYTKDTYYYHARNCLDAKNRGIVNQSGNMASGVWTIDPDGYGYGTAPYSVVCDQETDGGGWTVVQQRRSNSVSFYETWAAYKNGFGTIALNGNYWLGNDKINQLAPPSAPRELYIKLKHGSGEVRYEKYSSFSLNTESDRYRLSVSGPSGTAGDSLSYHSGFTFSTRDSDTTGSCVAAYKGGWWYGACHNANLNGLYLNGAHASYADGIEWYAWTGHYYSLIEATMMIR